MFKKHTWILSLLFFAVIILSLFWKFLLKGLVPIPGDILLGVYFPWLNDKWGTLTGVQVKNPLMSDIVSLMYPWRYTVIDYFKHGQLPLWDPASFLGESLIGNFQAGIFNPFNILLLLPWTFSIGWGVMVMLQPLLGMICMYVLLVHWKLSRLPAILGALAYGLSAQMIVWMEYNIHGFSIAVFPLAIYFVDAYLTSSKIKYLLFYSLLIAFVVFVGYPQYLYYFTFFSGLWMVSAGFYRFQSFALVSKQCLWLVLALVLGIGISAAQIIPGYESLKSSVRDVDTVALENNTAFLPASQVIMGIIPDFFGNPTTRNYWGEGYYESLTFYTSLVTVVLTLWAVLNKKRRFMVWMLILICALPFILAIDTPLARSIEGLKAIGLGGSVSTRILFVYSFGISVLGAIGLEFLLLSQKNKTKHKLKFSYLFLAGLLGVIILGLWFLGEHYITFPSHEDLTVSLHNSIWPGLIVLVSLMVVIIARRFSNKWIYYLLLPILLADMFRFSWKYLPLTRYDQIFPTTPILSFLESQPKPFRIAIEKAEVLTANTWEPYGLESPSGYDILVPHQTTDFLSYINYSKTGLASVRFVDILNFNSKLLDLANVEYVVTILRKKGVPDPQGDIVYTLKNSQYKPLFKDGSVAVLKNQNSLTRFFTVGSYQVVSDPNQALDLITSNRFDPSKEVTLNSDPKLSNLGVCPVNLLSYKKESFQFQADCKVPSLLFIANAYHPGWQALVNGVKSTIYKADDEFMAVVLPAGKSDIDLNFWPDSFRIGLAVSLVSSALTLALFILRRPLSKL